MQTIEIVGDLLDETFVQLGSIPLLQSLAKSELEIMVNNGTLLAAERGEIIIQEGDTNRDFFILLDGEMNLIVDLGEQGEYVDTGLRTAGEIIGEMAALLGEPRTATMVAASPCRLLRYDLDGFETLFMEIPAFGLAMNRQLAQRFRETFLEQISLYAETVPERITLEQPDLNHMRAYMARYYTAAIKNVFSKHQLILKKQFSRFEVPFEYSISEQKRWCDLFQVSEDDPVPPFTYFTTSGTMVLMKIVAEIGVNFKNLRHLKSKMTFAADGSREQPDTTYPMALELYDILKIREDRVVLVTLTTIYDKNKLILRENKDFFIILNIEPEYLKVLNEFKGYGRHDAAEFKSLTKFKPTLSDSSRVQEVTIEVPDKMGITYGKLSGDLNMIHTTKFAARLFGIPRPFIQGFCTANYVLRHLRQYSRTPLKTFTITFVRPVFVGSENTLRFDHTNFKVKSSKGKLQAFGTWSAL